MICLDSLDVATGWLYIVRERWIAKREAILLLKPS